MIININYNYHVTTRSSIRIAIEFDEQIFLTHGVDLMRFDTRSVQLLRRRMYCGKVAHRIVVWVVNAYRLGQQRVARVRRQTISISRLSIVSAASAQPETSPKFFHFLQHFDAEKTIEQCDEEALEKVFSCVKSVIRSHYVFL